jgi:hypothetical protein
MMEFFKRPLFSVNGLTLTWGLALVIVALIYFLVLRKR